MVSTFTPPGFKTLLDLVSEKGQELFSDKWTGEECRPPSCWHGSDKHFSWSDVFEYRNAIAPLIEKKIDEMGGVRHNFTHNHLEQIEGELEPLRDKLSGAWERWARATDVIRGDLCTGKQVAYSYVRGHGLREMQPHTWLDDKALDWLSSGECEGSQILIADQDVSPPIPVDISLPPFMEFMKEAVSELGLANEQRVPKKNVVSWLQNNWPEDRLGAKTDRRIEAMATFLRHPGHGKGGLFK